MRATERVDFMIKKYKKKDGTTAYMFTAYLGTDPITGKQKRTTRRGFKSEREAKIAEAKLQTETQHKGFLSSEVATFEEVYKLWIEQYQYTVRESTYQQVLVLFGAAILKYFKNIPIKKITIPYCQRVIHEWDKEYSDIVRHRLYASNVLDYAVKLRIITDNPFKHTKLPRKKETPQDDSLKYYNSDELQQFLSFTEHNPLYHAMFRTLAFTGFRRGELIALTWNDVDFNNQTITVNKTYATGIKYKQIIHEPKTKTSIRTISIDSRTASILKTWRTYQRVESLKHGHNTSDKHQHVFTNITNNKPLRIEYTNELLNRICKENNFKRITPHGFRHTHCSLLFEAGATIQEVKDRLGHNDIQTTMNVYAHVTKKQRDKVAEKFANYINF